LRAGGRPVPPAATLPRALKIPCLLRSAWRLADWAARRLTPGGLLVVAALLLAAVSGIDTELTLAYQLFALLAALLVVGRLGAWRLGGRYRVERHLPRCATVGEPVRYLGVVHNDGTRPCRELALIERTADPRPPIDALRAGLGRLARLSLILDARRWQDLVRRATPVPPRPWPLPEIAPGGRAEVRVEFVPERRGAVRFTGGWLARREPLGLFRALQLRRCWSCRAATRYRRRRCPGSVSTSTAG
jgi:hypothetical protein